tara:strand:+ start:3302 stop:3949 length:648 start_codon:yes stop_codon:yes gene_type:complete
MAYHLIFDLDGTLIDSAPDFHTSLDNLLQKYKLPTISLNEAREYIGNGFRGFVERFYESPNEELRLKLYQEFLEIYELNFLQATKPYDGAFEYIRGSQYKTSICTNKPGKFAEPTLEHYEILHHSWVGLVYGDTFPRAKPHPQGIEHLIHLSDIEKENTFFIGDGLPDALAAKNADVKFIGVDFGYHPPEELIRWGAIDIMSSFQDLDSIIQKHI